MFHTYIDATHVYSGRPVPTRLDYVSLDPFAVHFQFRMDQDDGHTAYVDWPVSRDLLLAGMLSNDWVGDLASDVHVMRADEDRVALRMESPDGMAVVLLPVVELSKFLGRSLLDTPLGDEMVAIEPAAV